MWCCLNIERMKTETSPQELPSRRQFLLQAAAVGGALVTPVNLLAQAEAVALGRQ
jgi:hypothetical protein